MNIQVEYVNPPVPSRKFDYMAFDTETYDSETGKPAGWGNTPESAIADLMGQQGATCEEVAEELIGRGFKDWQVAKVMNTQMEVV